MDKIVQFKNSFERLLKVWISKLDVSEQDLVAEDLIWIDEIFDKFFNDNNINEFILKSSFGKCKSYAII